MNAAVKMVNIQDAKTHLSQYLEQVQKGEIVVLCRHNKPVAEIRSLQLEIGQGIPEFGIYDGFGVSPEFFSPLPDEFLSAFEGK